MNSKARREIIYEDFEPTCNWVREEQSDTLVLLLSGFRREEMKAQVTSNHILKVSGEEKKKDKTSVARRFYKEFSVPREADINQIVAKFEDGKLYIKLPKTMTTKKKKQVWKLMIVGFIVALLMLVLVIWTGFRSNAMQHYSSPLGTSSSDIQDLFVDV